MKKFLINKNTHIHSFKDSDKNRGNVPMNQVADKGPYPIPFNKQIWTYGFIGFLIDCLHQIKDTYLLTDNQKKFITNFIKDLNEISQITKSTVMFTVNGYYPEYQRAKCLYDVFKSIINNQNEFSEFTTGNSYIENIHSILNNLTYDKKVMDRLGWAYK